LACARLLLLLLAAASAAPACYCIGAPHGAEAYQPYSTVIVDPDEFNTTTLGELTSQGKAVLAYINAGYAEEWRWYWPIAVQAGIVHEPTEYEGEHLVEYWSPAWRAILVNYTLSTLQQGYTGVYLDNIDAAEAIAELQPPWAQGVDPRQAMIDLVSNISSAAHASGGLVYVNIGAATSLLWDDRLLDQVDGVLREETLLTLQDTCKTRPADPAEALETLYSLLHAKANGKDVIAVEYVDNRLEAWIAWLVYATLGFKPVLQPACDPDYTRPPLPTPWAPWP